MLEPLSCADFPNKGRNRNSRSPPRGARMTHGTAMSRPLLSRPRRLVRLADPTSPRPEGSRMSAHSARGTRRAGSAVLAALLAFGLLLLGLAVPTVASADTRPDAPLPATVAADGLGTVQVNGVVWQMVTVGN